MGGGIDGKVDVSDWKDIVSVASGNDHIVGLRKDGTVVAVGKNSDNQCDVGDWKNVIAVAAGCFQTIGLTEKGKVLSVGYSSYGSEWNLN